MNTKSNQIIISPEFKELLGFNNKEEETEYNAQMISFRILSEVERICDEKKLKKKDLAELIGTSKSYITQLFSGNKSVNTHVLAKFEDALDITFQIKASSNKASVELEKLTESLSKMVNKRTAEEQGCWYYCYRTNKNESIQNNTDKIIGDLKTDNSKPQLAA